METTRTARLHLELDLEVTDAGAVQDHARSWAKENAGDNPETQAAMLEQAGEGPDAALMMLVEPSDVVGGIPGVMAVGATMWVEGPEGDAGDDSGAEDFAADNDTEDQEEAGTDALASGEGLDSEEDWLEKIFADADKLPGLNLERLGYDADEGDPDARANSLYGATMLRGAIHWAYESLIDELFDDISVLREAPDAIDETMQLSSLPPLHSASYGPLFAQRFLAVALDLGTAFASSFTAPSCVAQELALRLVLDGVEILPELLPSLELPEDWRGSLEDSLFEDLDHEFLYDPAMDGISSNPDYAQLRIVNLDFSQWFTPFAGRTVNPYAANE